MISISYYPVGLGEEDVVRAREGNMEAGSKVTGRHKVDMYKSQSICIFSPSDCCVTRCDSNDRPALMAMAIVPLSLPWLELETCWKSHRVDQTVTGV